MSRVEERGTPQNFIQNQILNSERSLETLKYQNLKDK